jgi:hypothetical protein
MSDTKTQHEQLSEELKLVEKAMDPKSAGASLKDYMDSQADKEGLGGFGAASPYSSPEASASPCCVIS